MNCPICGVKMEEWGLSSRPIYECPIHGRQAVPRPKPKGEHNPILKEEFKDVAADKS
jgi:hypothetical protein